jgi:hypothetical protein
VTVLKPEAYSHDLLSWPGTPGPVVGEAFLYRAMPAPYESTVLNVPMDALVYALDWFSEDGPEGRRVLHQLTVPQAAAERIGLAFTAFANAGDVVACAEAGGHVVIEGNREAWFRGADRAVAGSSRLPDVETLWAVRCVARAQRRGADQRLGSSFPLFLEWACTS